VIGKFADLTALAEKLAAAVPDELVGSHLIAPIVVALLPAGSAPGIAVANRLRAPLRWVAVTEAAEGEIARSGLAVVLDDLPADLAGAAVFVVVAAVETGQAARVIANELRARGAGTLTLLAGVVPRDSEVSLRPLFDQIVALVRPLGRRSATWHFETYAPEPLATAQAAVIANRSEEAGSEGKVQP